MSSLLVKSRESCDHDFDKSGPCAETQDGFLKLVLTVAAVDNAVIQRCFFIGGIKARCFVLLSVP